MPRKSRAAYFHDYNQKHPTLTLRLTPEESAQLGRWEEKWGVSRATAIRRIIYEVTGLGQPDGSLCSGCHDDEETTP